MKPLAFLGLDAGITSAYVILGLDGEVLKAHSAKELPLAEIIRQVMEACQPLVVGTDKAKVPSLVEEFSRKVGAIIVSPPQDLLREEKKQLLESCPYYDKSHHIQDSLAAALFAYKKYHPRLLKIDRFIKEQQLEDARNEFTLLAMKEDLHFSLIKEILTRKTEEHQILQRVTTEQKITKKDFLSLFGKLSDFSLQNQRLQQQLASARQQLQQFQQEKKYLERRARHADKRIDALFKSKEQRFHFQREEIRRKQEHIQALQQERTSFYSFIASLPQHQLLKRLPTLSQRDFQLRKELLNLQPNDVLWVENTAVYSEKVLQELQGQGIIIVSPQKISSRVKEKFISLHFPDQTLQHNEYFALLEKGRIEELLERQEMVERVVEEYRKGR